MENYGYATELEYVNDFIPALNPLWIDFCLLLAGFDTPMHPDSTSFDYLELGFGKGNSLTLNASCSEGRFVGNDFIPAHCEYAQHFIYASKANAKVYKDNFEQLKQRLDRENLKFDYIILHGVWSWISQENQRVILEIISTHLKEQGIVYVSYNCFPGWEGKYSLRHLLKLVEQNAQGNQAQRIEQSIHFAKQLFESNPLYIEQNPHTQEMYHTLQTRETNYLCHEFFNKDWHCVFFSQMAHFMAEVQCAFACSAKLMWNFDPQTFTQEQQALLTQVKDSTLQEQLKDYFLNESFRMDIFIRRGEKLTQKERDTRLLQTSFVLLKPLALLQLSIPPILKTLCMQILEFFARDSYAPKTLQNLIESSNLEQEILLPILCALMTQEAIHPTRTMTLKAKAQANAYNQLLFAKQTTLLKPFLASPLIGGIFIEPITWVCLKGYTQGVCKKESLMQFVRNAIPNLQESFEDLVEQFLNELALYKTLGILQN